MGRPTFPARNQWSADTAQPARLPAPLSLIHI